MRVVALLMVACGCRVGTRVAADATVPRADGSFERVVTDVAPSETAGRDMTTDMSGGGKSDAMSDRVDAGSDRIEAGAARCSLLSVSCPNKEGCYPFPFETVPAGQTACSFAGVGTSSVPCQSQVECDATSICSAPGEPDSVCLDRCDLATFRCPIGSTCTAYPGYPGVGVCAP